MPAEAAALGPWASQRTCTRGQPGAGRCAGRARGLAAVECLFVVDGVVQDFAGIMDVIARALERLARGQEHTAEDDEC